MKRFESVAVALAATAISLGLIPTAFAAFSSSSESSGNLVTAASDFRAPQVTAVALGKAAGGATGFLKQGGSYFVYANVAADTGNPASGVATVTADVSKITIGSIAVPLVAGSYTAGEVSYSYRSASLLADAVLAEGPKTFTVTTTDKALNAGGANGTGTIDNTQPAASDLQTTNAGASGLAEQGDTLRFTFSEPVEPESVLAGWKGSATSVVVRLNDNGIAGLPLGNDSVQVYNATNSVLLPLGTVDLGRSDYLAGLLGGSVRFGASGTSSTMSMSGNLVTVTLGTYNATVIVDPSRTTATGTGTASWTPVTTPYDRASNPMSAAAATESGSADKEF